MAVLCVAAMLLGGPLGGVAQKQRPAVTVGMTKAQVDLALGERPEIILHEGPNSAPDMAHYSTCEVWYDLSDKVLRVYWK